VEYMYVSFQPNSRPYYSLHRWLKLGTAFATPGLVTPIRQGLYKVEVRGYILKKLQDWMINYPKEILVFREPLTIKEIDLDIDKAYGFQWPSADDSALQT
jgi:hypothetical protein